MESDSSVLPLILVSLLAIVGYAFLQTSYQAIYRSRRAGSKVRNGDHPVTLFERAALVVLRKVDFYLLSIQMALYCFTLFIGWVLVNFALAYVTQLNLFSAEIPGGSTVVWVSLTVLLYVGAVAFLSVLLVRIVRALIGDAWRRALQILALPVHIISKLVLPFTWSVEFASRRISSAFRLRASGEYDRAISAEELSEIVEHSSEHGQLEEDDSEIIQSVFSFADRIVRQVMTPRKDIIAVPESASLSEILAIYEEDGLSRLVVFGQDLDDIKGVLLMKDLIPLMGKEVTEFKVNDYLREPLFVPDSCDLGDLLKTFRQVGNHLAIVLDEHGGVDGLVTMEDVMEEIVGEIFDEYDTPEEECEIRPAADGELLVDGGVLINDLNQDYEFSFPTGEYDTFAGFVFHVLGKIPQAGEIIDYEGVRIKVEEIEQNRIKLLRILRLEPTPLPS